MSQPSLTPEDIIVNALNILTCSIKQAPLTRCNSQLHAINNLRELFNQWLPLDEAVPNPTPLLAPCDYPTPSFPISKRSRAQEPLIFTIPMPSVVHPPTLPTPAPRRMPAPSVHEATSKGGLAQPISHQTRSCNVTPAPPSTPSAAITQPLNAPVSHRNQSPSVAENHIIPRQADGCRYPKEIILSLAFWALPVLDKDAGKILNFCQIHNHPKLAPIWNESLSNEMGRLFQGMGVGKNVKVQ